MVSQNVGVEKVLKVPCVFQCWLTVVSLRRGPAVVSAILIAISTPWSRSSEPMLAAVGEGVFNTLRRLPVLKRSCAPSGGKATV
jgi:hypothetical protein